MIEMSKTRRLIHKKMQINHERQYSVYITVLISLLL